MRRRLHLLPALIGLALPASAAAATGGASVPGPGGGAEAGRPVLGGNAGARSLVATIFAVDPGRLDPKGPPARFRYRIDGRTRRVRVRIDLVRSGEQRVAKVIRLGYKRTGRSYTYRFRTPGTSALPPGQYEARLQATGAGGRTLVPTVSTPGTSRVEVVGPPPAPVPSPSPPLAAGPAVQTPALGPGAPVGSGLFPVHGPYDLGGDGARFGADRHGRTHQGHDIIAAEGTPLVSVRNGTVHWRAYQASGAGHYVVIRGDDNRDYVYMHLRSGSVTVSKGDAVAAGQQIAEVGNTGSSSTPHLHFEIWPNGWYASDSQPIDPLPELLAWAAG